ncbi:MAG: BlaI/MecI/CopY family transcriptional regulator [Acidobacteria bacterium]|nr:BlaI/MecI/CopY family transcriptional regulator [Acidobacteriota bacterium]
MAPKQLPPLSRRERQIMDVIYQRGRATAADVQDSLPDAPGYSAIRALLRILEEKGHLHHEMDGQKYVFLPATPREQAKRGAMRHLLETFFDGSVEQAVAAMLDSSSKKLKPEELERLSRMIDQARDKGEK